MSTRPRRRISITLVAVIAAVLTVAPSAAFAGTLSLQGTTLTYTESDAALLTNQVDVVESAGRMYLRDLTSDYVVDAASGCTNAGTTVPAGSYSNCALPTAWSISLGGGNDSLSVTACCQGVNVPMTVNGGPGNDSLSGGNGADVLNGGPGIDSMIGAAGNDTATYAASTENVTVTLDNVANDGGGSDSQADNVVTEAVVGGTGDDTLDASMVSDANSDFALNGGPGDDTLTGGAGDDTLTGGADDDLLDGRNGGDAMDGGAGADTVTYAARTENLNVTFDNVANDGGASDSRTDNVITDIVVAGTGNDALDGSMVSDPNIRLTLRGGVGVDTITGGAGDDTLDGGNSNDLVDGGSGADELTGGPGVDTLKPGLGHDAVFAGAGVDSIDSVDGTYDLIDCGGNHDDLTNDESDAISNCSDPAPPASNGGGSGDGGSTTASTQQTQTTTPTPPAQTPPATAPAVLAPTVIFSSKAGKASTMFTKLVVSKLASGATVTVKCRTKQRKRCAGTKDLKIAKALVTQRLKAFEKKRLPVGAKLTITATKPGAPAALKILTIRKSKKPLVATA